MGTERRGRTSVKMQGRDECAERRNKGMRPIKKMIEDEGEGLCRCNKRQEYDSKWKTMQMLQGKIILKIIRSNYGLFYQNKLSAFENC